MCALKESVIKMPVEVNEGIDFPDFKDQERQTIKIDMGGLRMMNSAGIRRWIRWIGPLSAAHEVQLIDCPMAFLNLSSFVAGVIPPSARLISFFLLYKTDAEENLYLRFRPDPRTGKFNVPEVAVIEGEPGVEEKYFNFDDYVNKTFARLMDRVQVHSEVTSKDFENMGISYAS